MEKIDINANKSEAARCLKCRNARCSAACPVHTDIPALMSLYLQGKKDEAAAILLKNNPMAAISSRVCDWSRVCLSRCILNARQSPVNWHSVEAEMAGDAIFRMKIRPGDATGKSVGIIGAGPAGISAAIWLREAGHDVVIYDSCERPGGVLRYGIPAFRLDRKYIDRYEVILEEAGVAFRGGTIVGEDITLRGLRGKHDAVLIAAGAGIPRKLDVPGEEDANVIYALDYLKDPSAYNLGRNVIVIGGGNVTMDACRTAVRQGCDTTVYYRKSFENMPANAIEVELAREEGVKFALFEVPVGFNEGRAVMRKCENVLRPDGRVSTKMLEGTEHEVEFDTMLVAISANVDFDIFGEDKPALNRYGWPETNDSQQTSLKDVFIAGDFILGPATVVDAVASAKKAVAGSMNYLCPAN